MPGKKGLPGASKSDEKQYEAVKDKIQSQGSSRAKEEAARIVNARKAKEGRTKDDKK